MNKEDIIEGNRLLAEFLGWKFNKERRAYHIPTTNRFPFKGKIEDLKFDSDWNWLLLVVGKISEQCEEPEELDDLRMALLCNDIDTAYEEVIDYIKYKQ